MPVNTMLTKISFKSLVKDQFRLKKTKEKKKNPAT